MPCEIAGRCCYFDDPDWVCIVGSEAECDGLSGVWASGVDCTTDCGDTCVGSMIGVCCIDNVCSDGMSCETCAGMGGTWVEGPADCDSCGTCCD